MELVKVKKASEIEAKLGGDIDAEVETESGTVRRLVLSYGDNHKIIISGTYGIDIYVEAPPKMVKRFRLHGKFKGIDISDVFTTEDDAKDKRCELEGGYRDTYELKVSPIEMTEEAAERFDREAAEPSTDDDVAF